MGGRNGREVGMAGGQAGVGGKGRELYLNNNKIREEKNENKNKKIYVTYLLSSFKTKLDMIQNTNQYITIYRIRKTIQLRYNEFGFNVKK